MPPLVVHHLERSRSERIVFLLEELGLPYSVRLYRRDAATSLAPPELLAVHPLGKAPVLTDGDRVVAESAAILEYVLDAYDHAHALTPEPEEKHTYRYWMHYAEGSAAPPFVMLLVLNGIERAAPRDMRETARELTGGVKNGFVEPNIHAHLAFLEDALAAPGRGPWFCGKKFTAADIQLSFVVEMAEAAGFLKDNAYPRLSEFLQRIHERPAYKRAAAHGGFLARL